MSVHSCPRPKRIRISELSVGEIGAVLVDIFEVAACVHLSLKPRGLRARASLQAKLLMMFCVVRTVEQSRRSDSKV